MSSGKETNGNTGVEAITISIHGTANDNTSGEIRCGATKRFVFQDVKQQDRSGCKSWIEEHIMAIIVGAVMLILVVVAVTVTLCLLSIDSTSTESTTMAIGTTTHEASAVSEFDTSNTNGLALRSTTITHTSTTESTANAKTTPISTTIIQNSPTTELTNEWLMGDCGNISQFYPVSGEYVIQPSEGGPQINVYCDIREDGNWTVIQRRQDGSVDFYRNWTEYKEGFGNEESKFWFGNEQINRLTADRNFELMVEMTDHLNVTKFAKYSQFHVGTEDSNYVLTISGYTGTAGDSLAADHNGQQFTTYDTDNDKDSGSNCAVAFKGAWWYNDCHQSNLNGLYLTPGTADWSGINWYHFHNDYNSLKKTVMMVKRVP
ncbi:microfibril-associated glycoprotein 4-like [Antedon mediterranea]|uniref:microfibril-associated glycoprotein 4-like n=1 Tax=Antedon mediterranea TaxID=105859 RepID=UPI003AF5AA2B